MLIKRGEATEFENGKFIVEASDLLLPPGQFPERIETELGNGLPFFRSHVDRDAGGDTRKVIYRQDLGCISLHVLND